ncbi:MAG TPA: sialidase family protein [Candidatus Polarisedimenticolaceae bacterium]
MRSLLWACTALAVSCTVTTAGERAKPDLRTFPEELEKFLLRQLQLEGLDGASAVRALPAARTEGTIAGAGLAEVPSAEIALDLTLATQGAFDRQAVVLGRPGTPVCVVEIEDHRLRSLRSFDGGATFAPAVDVSGGAGAGAVVELAAALASDGKVYAAWSFADPAGDRGLRFARSSDGCQSWSSPTELVAGGSAALGVTLPAVATGASGRVAVAFVGRNGFAAYVAASADSGATWSGPVRVDAGSGASSYAVTGIDVAIDAASHRILAAFAQNRGTTSSIWQTRSTDGGATFAAEQNLDAITANKAGSDLPNVEVVANGVVLIAYWDDIGNNSVFVARSEDGGGTYSAAWDDPAGSSARKPPLVLAYDPAASTIQLAFAYNNSLWHTRSTDDGATFDVLAVLSSTADADPRGSRPAPPPAIARTESGTWVLAWSDTRSDAYADTRSDVYVRRSTDGGATWQADLRADTDAAGAAGSQLSGVAATGGDAFFAGWIDRRNGSGRDEDLYANRWAGAFGSDYRIDTDAATASAAVLGDPVVATDGANGVYVAFTAKGNGHEYDVWVARSNDGGYTFPGAVRVGSNPAGQRVQAVPYLAATSDGRVYLVYYGDNPATGERELRFNRSLDFGVTWSPLDTILDSWPQTPGYVVPSFDYPNVQLVSPGAGAVYVAWSDNVNVFLARSFDGGATFSTADVDQDARGYNRHPALCAQGNQIVLAIMAPKVAFDYFSVWGTVSTNQGASWSSLAQLRSESTAERGVLPVVACDGSNKAAVVWMDRRDGASYVLRSNRWTGSAWGGDVAVSGPAGVQHFYPRIAYAGATKPIVVYQDLNGSVYASRSSDSGASFPAYVRLDATAPDPAQVSDTPRIASDGNDAWTFWIERSAGERSVVARVTRDGGVNFDAVRRIDRETPQGAFYNGYYVINAAPAAVADAGFLAWAGVRGDGRRDVLVNVVDLDDADRDGAATATDCDDSDPASRAVPSEVAALALSKVGSTTRLNWTSQDGSAGAGTSYEVKSGSIAQLRGTGGFADAVCVGAAVADPPFDDPRDPPAVGAGYYYLLRARNGCGTGTFGDSGRSPDPRDGLDAGAACP